MKRPHSVFSQPFVCVAPCQRVSRSYDSILQNKRNRLFCLKNSRFVFWKILSVVCSWITFWPQKCAFEPCSDIAVVLTSHCTVLLHSSAHPYGDYVAKTFSCSNDYSFLKNGGSNFFYIKWSLHFSQEKSHLILENNFTLVLQPKSRNVVQRSQPHVDSHWICSQCSTDIARYKIFRYHRTPSFLRRIKTPF